MIRILAGGPARDISSPLFFQHRDGLIAQRRGVFTVDVSHEPVSDPGGPRWTREKIARVARCRRDFMQRARPYDALFMVDADVVVAPGVLERMWAVDANVVYGVFWTHCDWGGHLADWPQVWDINPYGWTPECIAELRAPGVNEVEVLGGGACTLIRGRGFESHYWPLLKSFAGHPSMMSGEDRTYCLGLECRGIRQVAVTGLPIEHRYDH